ncbi:uncharacterized protein LOC112345059 [Selaginella moellendorffii]|uniref:uncharacterized protein LOC112345059 n=1 Tax=Selaginella moellendorffii TaxID=88036 RepID=UPI000D1C68CD|nr:uncharacterized protein LOC112345059 [Selaginella moellendorffii]|eukprot:XP_024526700.1 uncharacterized protein LOC112345059 [Selaginella moellendorffii]
MGKLATMILRTGGKCKFEAANGWDTFVSGQEGMNKPALPAGERRKCIRTIKRLYNRFMMEFVQETLKEMGLEDDGDSAAAEVSDGGGNDEDDDADADASEALNPTPL